MSVFSWRTIIPQSIHVIRQWHHHPCLLTLRVDTWPRNSFSKHCWMSQQAWKMHGALSGTAGRWVFFLFGHTASGTLVLRPGIRPQPHSVEYIVLTTGPPWNSRDGPLHTPKITQPVCSGRNEQEWKCGRERALNARQKHLKLFFSNRKLGS